MCVKLHAKTIVFTLMDNLRWHTQELVYAFFELRSVCSLRHFLSVSREYAAVVSCVSATQQYPYIGSCTDVWQTCTKSFSVVSFTQLKKKCLQKLTSLAVDEVYYYSYVIHGCGHSHTLTIATDGTCTCNEPVMSWRSFGEHKHL